MPIAIASQLPQVTFKVKRDGATADLTTADVFAGKKVVLFAVPGAFTPTCHLKHLPGFMANLEAFKAKGIDTIACVAVNDHHVMSVWGDATGATGKILLLADGRAEFANAMGLAADMGALGVRSKRYAAYVDNGVLKALDIEGTAPDASSAEALLAKLPA